MKKCLLGLMAIICVHTDALAQKFEVANSDGVKIKYEVLSGLDRTVQVTGGERPDELVIPATVVYNGVTYSVTAIKKKAYMPATRMVHKIRRLVLPEGLVEIGDHAFHVALKSDGNESIYIPSTVRIIGKSAFSKMGAGPSGNPRECNLENLSYVVNEINCEVMGLTKESVRRYYAYHPRPNATQNLQAAVVGQTQQPVIPSQSAPVQPVAKRPVSDVDVNIPNTGVKNENVFAVIFANENYRRETAVKFAQNDGEMFAKYCQLAMGLPANNIHLVKDATLNDILAEVDWLEKVAKAYRGDARIVFYYAGHGIPDEAKGTSYLLPCDGIGTNVNTAYSLKKLYEQLGALPVRDVTVFLDACFSGAQRGDGMLASARGVAIKAKPQAPQGNMVVFSAATGDETAYPYEEKGHGMFTYFLLKKMQETKGTASYGELGDYVNQQVSRRSIVDNGKSQTPTVVPSAGVGASWRGMKLK